MPIRKDGDKYRVTLGQHRLCLSEQYAVVIAARWRLWEKVYLPSFPLEGKVVLDLGAGEGETALFFFTHGAARVMCVEREDSAAERLMKNARDNEWNVEILHEPFQLNHLDLEHDYLKFNMAAQEGHLLQYQARLRPCCIVSTPNLAPVPGIVEKLTERFGLRTAAVGTMPFSKVKRFYLVRG